MLKWDLVSAASVYWTVKVMLSSLGLSLLLTPIVATWVFFLLLETFVQGAATF